MKLTEKEFIKADGTVVKLTPEWISTKLGEVYELSCIDKIDQERLHYGYMTEALVSFLETTDEKGVPFFERVELKSIDVGNNRISNLLNQKVILDKPSKIERENFYHDFKLWPTIYSDEKRIDDIVVKVHSEFTLCNREGDLELHFNDNLVELNVFELINSDDKKEVYNFNFEDRTKKLNSRELYQLSKDGAYPYTRNMIQNNANLNLSLAVDTKSIYIAENMDPIKRNISLSFGQTGYIFLRLARLNSDARDSTLTIDSDIIKLEESILNITGNNSFVMRNDNDKPTVIDSEYVKNMELNFDGTNVTIDAQTVNFDWWKTPSSNTEHAPSLNFHGENSFAAKNIVVFESNNRFSNSKVISHKTLSFKGMSNAIMDSEVSFSEKNQNYSGIKDFISRDSTLSDVSGTLTGSINSVKGEDITIKEGGQFNILPANAQETGVSTYLSSVTLEEGSELSIGANGVDKNTISLNNVKVSNGNNIVVFSQDTNIDNTQLSGVELSIEKNDSGKFEVSNSTLTNKIVLKNVSSVNLSEIDSSNLSSSTVVAIENEWIKDRITNVLDEILEKKKKGITFEDNSLILKTDKNLELL